VPTGKNNEYKVTLKLNIAKVWIDDKGNDVPDKNMNDYMDIGIFGNEINDKQGRSQANPLYFKKYKLTAGDHTITIMVKGKPKYAGIDPIGKLIDRNPNDNLKDF
jgi:hypothetical protein